MNIDFLNNIYNKGFTKSEIDKIGNSLIYITQKLGEIPKTKAIKLLYFLEEKSINDSGIPFFGLDWKVWKLGPVDQNIYYEFSNSPELLREYISVTYKPENVCIINGIKEFNDDEFSDYDLMLLDKVVNSLGNKTASELSNLTHKKGGLWDKVVTERGLRELFDNNKATTSGYSIDFADLIKDDEVKIEMFNHYFDLKSVDKKYC
ncbi:Panacea domain-containing protein [Flavobacterium sp.]|uniref:Panacea domain-containing protein n=1 Tax=Flavobacterium sp. TaxID=239 RepID=UPI002616094A|nr:Panacea domain-containing protein [Flavobacterium sp.]